VRFFLSVKKTIPARNGRAAGFSPVLTTSLTRLPRESKITAMLAAETKVGTSQNEHASDPARSWKAIVEPVEPFLHAVTEQLVRQARDFDPQIVPYAEHALNKAAKTCVPPWSRWRRAALGNRANRM